MQTNYCIMHGRDAEHLAELVRAMLSKHSGWAVVGAPFTITVTFMDHFYQAMVQESPMPQNSTKEGTS